MTLKFTAMEFTRIYPNEMKQGEYILHILRTPYRYYGKKSECENLRPIFDRDARQMYLKELKKFGVVPADVEGGVMWHNECTGEWSWDVRDFLPWIPDEQAVQMNEEFTKQ